MAIEPTLDPAPNKTELDRSEESATTSLYRAAIGAIGTRFYMPLFSRFEAADRGGISWNWAASLNTLNWLAFRKLWSAALGYAGAAVGLALVIFGIGRLVFHFSEEIELGLLAAYAAVMFLVPGLFANALLHADCRKRMASALSANTTLPEACAMLARQASSRNRMIVIAAINLLLAGLLALTWTKLPTAGTLPEAMTALAKADPQGAKASSTAAGLVVAAASAPMAAPPASATASAASAPVVAKAASAPVSAPTPAPAASASRVVSGVVQAETPRTTASAPARAASQAAPLAPAERPASSPQEAGKVYRSEPTPPVAKPSVQPVAAASKPQLPVAGKPSAAVAAKPAAVAKPVATAKPRAAASAPMAAASASKTVSSAPKASGLFLVNVGLFAQDTNASNAITKLKDAGLPAYSDEIKGSKGKLTRVRVGPFTSQADADAAAVKIKGLGLDALPAPQ